MRPMFKHEHDLTNEKVVILARTDQGTGDFHPIGAGSPAESVPVPDQPHIVEIAVGLRHRKRRRGPGAVQRVNLRFSTRASVHGPRPKVCYC